MDLQLLVMEVKEQLPIDIGSDVSEEGIWEIVEGLSDGYLHRGNALIVVNGTVISHLSLVDRSKARNFKSGDIVIPVQVRELVLESYSEFTLFYDEQVHFDSTYVVIEYEKGCATVLLEELETRRREVLPAHWFELATVYGGLES